MFSIQCFRLQISKGQLKNGWGGWRAATLACAEKLHRVGNAQIQAEEDLLLARSWEPAVERCKYRVCCELCNTNIRKNFFITWRNWVRNNSNLNKLIRCCCVTTKKRRILSTVSKKVSMLWEKTRYLEEMFKLCSYLTLVIFLDKQTARKRAEESKGLHGAGRARALTKTCHRIEATAEKLEGRDFSIFVLWNRIAFPLLAKRASDSQAVPRHVQNSNSSIQGPKSTNPTNNTKRWTKSCDKKIERRATTKIDTFRRPGEHSPSSDCFESSIL